MANIKRLELIDLMFWDAENSEWKELHASADTIAYGFGPGSGYSVVIYESPLQAGIPPTASLNVNLRWSSFTGRKGTTSSTGWFILSDTVTGLLPTTTVSLKIRYKIRMTDVSETPVVTVPDVYYYQIILADVPADHISVTGTAAEGPCTPVATIELPGISNSMVANANSLYGWLSRVENWQISWTKPSGAIRNYLPTHVSVDNSESVVAEFAGAVAKVRLQCPSFNIAESGTHTLEFSLLPNAQETGGFHLFADDVTWVATIVVGTPYQDEVLLYSFGKDAFMTISFALGT